VFSDINAAMLRLGRERMENLGHVGNLHYVQADAQHLPFQNNHYDCVTIGFGLRNVTNKQLALDAIYRCIKPGGRLLVLEFSKPTNPALEKIYDLYSFNLLPKIGKLITQDEESYRYLAESIRMHPDQETLKGMMEYAGFERCDYFNLTGGIVALHRGYKL
jgi:demethylmenaquinone methyltransferase/2-methoxy-6-polyprenyl-1,4-benzoquinol methylase